MEKKEREEFKKTLKVIQGGKPCKKEMKKIVMEQFEELKHEFKKVKDYPYSEIEEVEKAIISYQNRYGLYLEKIDSKNMEDLDNRYEEFKYLLNVIKKAQTMKRNEAKEKRKKLGFEIVD